MVDWKKLAEPFPEADIEWRIAQAGRTSGGNLWAKVLCYVTNRAIQQRLDDVVGPENWTNSFEVVEGGWICGIGIAVEPQGDARFRSFLWKYDGSDPTDIESFKGGISGSMKRAAVQWGIGRYLYNMGESWADILEDKKPGSLYANCKVKSRTGTEDWVQFHWLPPKMPAWALPAGEAVPVPQPEPLTDPKLSFNAWIQPYVKSGQVKAADIKALLASNGGDYAATRALIEPTLAHLNSVVDTLNGKQ